MGRIPVREIKRGTYLNLSPVALRLTEDVMVQFPLFIMIMKDLERKKDREGEREREREDKDLLELELDGLEAGRGLHGPVAFVLRDLHDRGGGCGGLGTN